MTLEIKSKDGKDVYATAMIFNSLRCGHCAMPVMDGQHFYGLAQPYLCLVHESCLRTFTYNGVVRAAESTGRDETFAKLSTAEEVMASYMVHRDCRKRVPECVREAMETVLEQELLLRSEYSETALGKCAQRSLDARRAIKSGKSAALPDGKPVVLRHDDTGSSADTSGTDTTIATERA